MIFTRRSTFCEMLKVNLYRSTMACRLVEYCKATTVFFIPGSKDVAHGCRLCALNEAKDVSLTARLRIPDPLASTLS